MSNQLKEKCDNIGAACNGTPLQKTDDDMIASMLHNIVIYTGATQDQLQTDSNKSKFYWLLRKTMYAFTIEEIDLAFELAMSGEIKAELNLFGRPISILYISNVMKAYSEYVNNIKKQYFIQVSQEREKAEAKPPSKGLQFIAFKQQVVDNYFQYIESGHDINIIRNFGGVSSRFIQGLSITGFVVDLDHPDKIELAKNLYAKGMEGNIIRLDPNSTHVKELSLIVSKIYSGKDIDEEIIRPQLEQIYLADFFQWVEDSKTDIEELIQSHFKNFTI